MREVYQFSEEKFIDAFVNDLRTKTICFTDIDFSLKYINEEIKPMINVVDYMFVHHFISENGYFQCKKIYDEIINRGMNALKDKYDEEVAENNRNFEQRIARQNEYIANFIDTHKVGDTVKIKGTLIGTRLPRYLEGGCLTIVGFTKKGNVKCRWDEDTVFNISPCYLKDLE